MQVEGQRCAEWVAGMCGVECRAVQGGTQGNVSASERCREGCRAVWDGVQGCVGWDIGKCKH